MISLTSKQRGTFSIEMAIVGVFFSLLFVFSGDVIIKLTHKGKLDRLSYSLVNIVKERTQLYSKSYRLTDANVNTAIKIAKASFKRTTNQFDATSFGYVVESVTFDQAHKPIYDVFRSQNSPTLGIRCNVAKTLNNMTHLSKITTWGRPSSLYRVTLCYETDNWIGDLLGESFTRVQSDALMIGR
ncbi:tight adherence pilus pseudopilin TadF [Vibrio panuliri]